MNGSPGIARPRPAPSKIEALNACTKLVEEMLRAGGKLRPGQLADAAQAANMPLVNLFLQAGVDINEQVGSDTAFTQCALWTHYDMAEELLRRGANPYAGKNIFGTAVHHAVAKGESRIVEMIIAAKADLNRRSNTSLPSTVSETEAPAFPKPEPIDEDWVNPIDRPIAKDATLILVAVRCGHARIVRMLAEAGADLEIPDHDGFTPLAWALKLQRQDLAEILRQAGAKEPAHIEGNSFKQLMSAIANDDFAAAEKAIHAGAPIDNYESDFRHNITPLMAAAREGRLEIVRELLRAKADPNKAGREDLVDFFVSPLMLAARQGHAEVVAELLASGATIDARQVGAVDSAAERRRGPTALHEAAANGHAPVVQILLQAGADPNEPSIGGTPLTLAGGSGDAATISLLLAAGAKPSRPGNLTGSPLIAAATKGDVPAARVLLDRKININAASSDGTTPLTMAAAEGHIEMVKFLLASGAHPDPPVKQPFQTPLSAAARGGYDAIVALLIEAGANPNAPCFEKTTALHAAVIGNHSKCVELLLKAGATRDLKDADGCTPLKLARNLLEMYVEKPHPALRLLKIGISDTEASECRKVVELLTQSP